MRVALIVEGHGDVASAPILLGKIGAKAGIPIYPIRPIRSGGWPHLKRAGELERFVELALSHDPDRVVILVDLDDHCAAEESRAFRERIQLALGKRTTPVDVAFSIREFESWYLYLAQSLSEKIGNGQWDISHVPDNPEGVRGAKEALSRVMKSRYKETIHQARLATAVEIEPLFHLSRSFRRLVAATTGRTYEELVALMQ